MTTREQLHQLIDELAEGQYPLALTFLASLRAGAPQGWTPEEVADTRARLASFEEDWNAPGMEVYDEL